MKNKLYLTEEITCELEELSATELATQKEAIQKPLSISRDVRIDKSGDLFITALGINYKIEFMANNDILNFSPMVHIEDIFKACFDLGIHSALQIPMREMVEGSSLAYSYNTTSGTICFVPQ